MPLLTAVIVFFSLVDFICTKILIDRNGFGIEMNSLLQWMIQVTGTPYAILLFKAVAIALIGTLVFICWKRGQSYSKVIVGFMCFATLIQTSVALFGTYLVITQQ